ncbi:hypothetical protein JX266_011085 [Neoarthrinium moseri]|nr:hypothetical protein JX266_011085 [Neoarthrinium moseri]
MYAPWTRAFRAAVPHAPRTRVATRPGRHFHVSTAARAAVADNSPDDPPKDGNDKPGGDGREPGDREDAKDENLFGEKTLSEAEQSRGRQRRSNGASSRTRNVKSRAPEELPPVQLPEDFQKTNVYQHEDLAVADAVLRQILFPRSVPALSALYTDQIERMLDVVRIRHLSGRGATYLSIYNALAYDKSDIDRLLVDLRSDDLDHFCFQSAVTVNAAADSVLHLAPRAIFGNSDAKEVMAKLFKHRDEVRCQSRSYDLAKYKEMEHYLLMKISISLDSKKSVASALRNIFRSKLPFRQPLGILHHDLAVEAAASIRADFAINPPQHIKPGDLKRPITILNFDYYSGSWWPKLVVKNLGSELGANVIHITAQDIAEIVGSYLGQDTTHAPGPISLLGYKAAENTGRLHGATADASESPFGAQMPFSIVLPNEKPRKEAKKKMTIMDYILPQPNRGKSDEMWVDLKMNAVLEEIIHAADSNSSEQRPLIIHIHDINAINMDDECGSALLGRLRKAIDNLWVEGRKIVLVGTCASLNAPAHYSSALKELESNERVITFHEYDPSNEPYPTIAKRDKNSANLAKHFQKRIAGVQKDEYLDENARNIKSMLKTLLGISHDSRDPRVDLKFHAMDEKYQLESLSESILPVTEVYRIVKTMIGFPRQQSDHFDQGVLQEALHLIKHVDAAKDRIAKTKDTPSNEVKRNVMGGNGPPGGNLADYEERFKSALVNPENIRTTFGDVHVPRETIDSIKMLTQLSLLRPEAFAYGVLATDRIPGCLLYGPPGTGKTLLAKAVAKESGANMVEVSGASINQMYVGESEKNIRGLFSLAKKKEPLVIFIDEADALLGARGRRNDGGGRRDVINQFLREWDGMDTSKAFIMVATNRPFDLDEAVLRRLPRKLLVDLPLEEDRAAILKIHLKGEALDDTVSIEKMAKDTPLYSGSDLKNVCVAAAMAAVKEELEASEKHTGPKPYVWPEKRILNHRHFEKALAEIPASVNEDMATLSAIKKFDERYGEKKARRKRRGMGFEVVPEATDSHEARVRGDR